MVTNGISNSRNMHGNSWMHIMMAKQLRTVHVAVTAVLQLDVERTKYLPKTDLIIGE